MLAVAVSETRAGLNRIRVSIQERLQARREEIERSVLNRIHGISDPSELSDPVYLEGLRATVVAALDYGLTAIEQDEKHPQQMPAVLLVQARTAARLGISLDSVLRRYFAGYAVFGDYLLEEAEKDDLIGGPSIKSLLRTQAALFDRVVAEVSEEHARETAAKQSSAREQRAERVQRLLAGELLDTADLNYDFDDHHLGVLAVGDEAAEGLRGLAGRLDCRLLMVSPGEGPTWAWLGTRRRLDPAALEHAADELWPDGLLLSIGESWRGLAGWRLTHQQARAALPVAIRGRRNVVRYSEVALLASILQDDLLSISLRELYLAPLEAERDGGAILRKTMCAFFAAEHNVSSAAAALGVSRRTVANRLQKIEARVGRPLGSAMLDMAAALRLEELTGSGIQAAWHTAGDPGEAPSAE